MAVATSFQLGQHKLSHVRRGRQDRSTGVPAAQEAADVPIAVTPGRLAYYDSPQLLIIVDEQIAGRLQKVPHTVYSCQADNVC